MSYIVLFLFHLFPFLLFHCSGILFWFFLLFLVVFISLTLLLVMWECKISRRIFKREIQFPMCFGSGGSRGPHRGVSVSGCEENAGCGERMSSSVSQVHTFKKKKKTRCRNTWVVVLWSVPCTVFRLNASLSAHPEKDELILFGGEYFNGKKVQQICLYFGKFGRHKFPQKDLFV